MILQIQDADKSDESIMMNRNLQCLVLRLETAQSPMWSEYNGFIWFDQKEMLQGIHESEISGES